jgi:hypothetical protein
VLTSGLDEAGCEDLDQWWSGGDGQLTNIHSFLATLGPSVFLLFLSSHWLPHRFLHERDYFGGCFA